MPDAPAGDGHKLVPIDLRDEVYKRLRHRILGREYPPGFRFDLPALEAQLGVSRTPIKEALHRLEAEGLVEIRPRRGTYVISIDPDDLADSFDVRCLLELHAASLALRRASDDEVAQLAGLAAEMKRLIDSHDYQTVVNDYIRLDHRFHTLLVQLSGSRRLINLYRHVDVHVQIARVRQQFTRADSLQTEDEHQAILDAFARRDTRALAKAVRSHIDRSKARMLKVLETNG